MRLHSISLGCCIQPFHSRGLAGRSRDSWCGGTQYTRPQPPHGHSCADRDSCSPASELETQRGNLLGQGLGIKRIQPQTPVKSPSGTTAPLERSPCATTTEFVNCRTAQARRKQCTTIAGPGRKLEVEVAHGSGICREVAVDEPDCGNADHWEVQVWHCETAVEVLNEY